MHLSKSESRTALAYAIFVAVSCLLILTLSVARASLEICAQENNENKVRVNDIQLTRYLNDGTTQPINYRLPEVSMLPVNPFYGFKMIRDWLWINLSRSPMDKAKISLLMADKKISEARELFAANSPTPALEAASEALKKLQFASSQLSKVEDKPDEVKQVNLQMISAGLAYKEIAEESKNTFGLDTEKYNKLITDLDSWNETKAKEEEQ